MKRILILYLVSVWFCIADAEVRFNPLNVYRIEGVVGVTHDELRDAISSKNPAFSNAVNETVATKADKPVHYVEDNLAAITADGNLKDSGKKASDFAPAVDGGYLPLNDGGTVNGDTTFLGSFYAGPYGDILGVTHDAGHLYKHDSVKWYYGSYGKEDDDEIAVKGDISALASSKADRSELGGYLPLSGGIITGNLNVNYSINAGHNLSSTFFSTAYSTSWGDVVPALYYSRWYYLPNGSEYPKMSDNEIAVKGDIADAISSTSPTFSDAVLAVNVDFATNTTGAAYVAVTNALAGFGFDAEALAELPGGKVYGSIGALLAALAAAIAWLKKNKVQTLKLEDGSIQTSADGGVAKLDDFFTNSNSLLTGTIDEEVISKGTAPDAHLEASTDEQRLKLVLADNSVAYDSAKALPYKLTSVIGDRVVATMTLTAASTDITLPTIAANDTTVKDFILDVTNAYAVEGVATDAVINIPRTDSKLVTRDGESLTDVTTVKAGKSAFICFTQKSPVVVDGTTYPCWCVIQLPFGDPS